MKREPNVVTMIPGWTGKQRDDARIPTQALLILLLLLLALFGGGTGED